MTSALAYKEFRETLGIAALGLAALVLVAAANMGFSLWGGWLGPHRMGMIPFVSSPFVSQFTFAAAGLALALGFRQSIGDFLGDAQLFLLHRPVSRRRIYATKLAIGLAVYLACSVVPIAIYAAWAATPGTHASPFEWSMTTAAWVAWLALTTVYLGAFLAGIRPAAWFGTRLAPLVAAATMAVLMSLCWFPLAVALVVAADVLLVSLILTVAYSRDFS